MDRLSFIAENLRFLYELPKRGCVLDDLPRPFRPDLQKFIAGETLSMQDGKIVVGHNLYKRWLLKLTTRGFDYEIDWKQ